MSGKNDFKKDNKIDNKGKKGKDIIDNVLHTGQETININKFENINIEKERDHNIVIDFNQVNNMMQSMNNQIDSVIDNAKGFKNGDQKTNVSDKPLNIVSNNSNNSKSDLIADPNFQTNFPQLEEIDEFVEDVKDIDQDWLETFLDESNKKGLQVAKRT